ncbi:hypothetical protein CA13_60070 [Planctomycetes bacterium CA13]|uniref:HEAT repeat protein n=1 Tax=Novipirellula herctigrandis TaxID=2527986 RepID=A0A5C5ZBL4_9BACT|nr:hypothetical protein CA13_60070 [Planctomycetes bacterium CA13]
MDAKQRIQTLLASSVSAERLEAAEQLCQMGQDASFVAAELVAACADDEEDVRASAVGALEELGPPPVSAIDSLIALATSNDPLAAYWAITLLGRAETNASGGAATLVDVLSNSSDGSARQRAAWALGKIGAKDSATIAALQQAAASGDPRLARIAQQSLTQ